MLLRGIRLWMRSVSVVNIAKTTRRRFDVSLRMATSGWLRMWVLSSVMMSMIRVARLHGPQFLPMMMSPFPLPPFALAPLSLPSLALFRLPMPSIWMFRVVHFRFAAVMAMMVLMFVVVWMTQSRLFMLWRISE